MHLTQRGRTAGWVLLWALIATMIAACGDSGPPKVWVGRIARDMDTTGTEYKALYINEGSSRESQSLTIFAQGGAWPLGFVSYGNEGNQRTEQLEISGKRNPETFFWMSTEVSSERSVDITEGKYGLLRWTNASNQAFQTTKNEMEFLWPGLLPEQETFKLASTYTVPMTGDVPDIQKGKHWFDTYTSESLLGDRWRPFSAVVENSALGLTLPANWAQSNESFDQALQIAKATSDSLRANNWMALDPRYGKLKMVQVNPNGALEVFGFENAFLGYIWTQDGYRVDYRVVPVYNLLDQNLYFGYGKAHSKQAALESLLWQIHKPGAAANDGWVTVAGAHFLKGRFAANGLYAFKRYAPGEDPTKVVAALKAEMDADVPADMMTAGEIAEGGEFYNRIINWMTARKPWNLQKLREGQKLEVAAVVRYADISDRIQVWESCGKDCSHLVTHTTTPRKELVWNISATPAGIEFANHLFAVTSETFAKAFDMGYVQADAGDGTSFILGVLGSILREQQNKSGYDEAVRLDQRAPVSPDMIDGAVDDIFGHYADNFNKLK